MVASGSMAASVSIRPAEPRDREEILALHLQAFAEDPIVLGIAAYAPQPQAAQQALIRSWLDPYLEGVEGGLCDLAVETTPQGERILGAMTWNPSDGDESLDEQASDDESLAADPEAVTLFGNAIPLIEADHRLSVAASPREPHWYACMIVVSPQAQGKGVGSALMRHGLERADRDGLPAHLESTTPDSRRLYERFGFAAHTALQVGNLPTYWAMTRPAQR